MTKLRINGDILTDLRADAGYASIEELARAADVTTREIEAAETGNLISFKTLEKLSEAMKLDISTFFESGTHLTEVETNKQLFQKGVIQFRKLLLENNNIIDWNARLQTTDHDSVEYDSEESTISLIHFSPDARYLAASFDDGTIRIWDTREHTCSHTIEHFDEIVTSIQWSPNGDRLAIGTISGLELWSYVQGKAEQLISHSIPIITKVIWSPNSEVIATISAEKVYLTTIDGHQTEFYYGHVRDLSWSPDGTKLCLATETTIRITNIRDGNFTEVGMSVKQLEWSPHGNTLATISGDAKIRILDAEELNEQFIIEGHTGNVQAMSFSQNGEVLATKAADDSIRLWDLKSCTEIASFESANDYCQYPAQLTFAKASPWLASIDAPNHLQLWQFDFGLLEPVNRIPSIGYTSAKVVLVGDSNVGKSCLAMRLTNGRYPNDFEHGTTHGMRFWTMKAEDLHSRAKPPIGHRRDVVFWDFGGQDEYQLVHQMFLHDTILALVLIDPTRGKVAIDSAREWNMRLEKHLGKSKAIKLLIGTQVDSAKRTKFIDLNSIENLKKECGFRDFIDVSSLTGRNTGKLKRVLANSIAWDSIIKTSHPELFQAIREEVIKKQRKGDIVIAFAEFDHEIHSNNQLAAFDLVHHEIALRSSEDSGTEAIRTVCTQLAEQGVIVQSQLMTGDEALVLHLPTIESYAGSLILAARDNPRGVPVLEERLLGSTNTIPLPGMLRRDRLDPARERMVLECIVELMIQHGICFRHGGLLVFPTLFPTNSDVTDTLPHSVSLYYDFCGAIDSIYASLVARLVVGEEFGEGRLWNGRVEFDRPDEGVCGIRNIKRSGGFAHLDLFFSERTPKPRRDLFVLFIEEHLRHNGVDIREHQSIKCECGKIIDEFDVQSNIAAGEIDVICPRCRKKTLISDGSQQVRERSLDSSQRILALRKKIEERTAADTASVKKLISMSNTPMRPNNPIRILHLSDLHFEKDTSPTESLQWLLQDLRSNERNYPVIDHIDYLVLSGDVTHRGDSAGFDKARQFVLAFLQEFRIDALRCVMVPGNHDIEIRDSYYRYQSHTKGLSPQQFVSFADKLFLVRDENEYPNRFKGFSDSFYHKITCAEYYPLASDKQAIPYFFADTGLQFIALNSAWEIDQFNPKRSSVQSEALANALRVCPIR